MSSSARISGGSVPTDLITRPTRKLSSLERVDYADTFTLKFTHDTPNTSPEQWIRAMFGDVPTAKQTFIWSGLLRLPLLLEPSPGSVAGWRIGKQNEDGIQIENRSWLLSGNLIVQKTNDSVSLTTLIQHRSLLSGIWWRILSAVHRSIIPSVLLRAEDKIKKV